MCYLQVRVCIYKPCEILSSKEASMFEIDLKIDGMACGMCETHVNDAIRNALDVKKVKSSHKKGTTTIIAESEISEAELAEILKPTGYKLLAYEIKPYEKKGLFSF